MDISAVKYTGGSKMNILKLMEWLREHLADFPIPSIAEQFKLNGQADSDALLLDKIEADECMMKRAKEMSGTYHEESKGREAMNTVLCVLYSPQAVSKLIRAAFDDADGSNRLTHVFVLRVGEAFLLLLTASSTKRLPLDKFMSNGEHTSAYMWLNLKEKCWEPYSQNPTKKKKHKCWQTLSQETISGIHILCVMWRRCKDTNYVYVKPPPTNGDTHSDAWVVEVERFADHFTFAKTDAVVDEVAASLSAAVETAVAEEDEAM
jgi:hypothetical protein